MKNIISSCFSKKDKTYIDYLKMFIEEADNYEKSFKVKNVLKDQEKKYFEYIIKSFESSGETPSSTLFENVFPETKGVFGNATQIPVNDLRVYIFNVIDLRINQYINERITQLNSKVRSKGITSEIADEFSKLQALSNRNKAKDININIDARDEYNRLKMRPTGLVTGIGEVDKRIGGMNAGTVTTIAGFTGQFKCVSENERILTNRGMYTIKEIYSSGVNSGLEVQSEYGFRKLVAVHDEGVKESRIVSIGGIPIETSPVHKFRVLTNDGELVWKEAQNLNVGDKVVQSLKESRHSGIKGDPAVWRLYGQLCGDGGHTGNTYYLCGSLDTLKYMMSEKLFAKLFTSYSKTIILPKEDGYKEQFLLRAVDTHAKTSEFKDFIGKNSKTKEFPDRLYYLDSICWKEFILGLYETDGCSGENLGYTLANKKLLIKLSRLLSGLGISTTLVHIKDDAYRLKVVGNRSKNRFMKIVGNVKFKASKVTHFDEIKDISKPFYTREEFSRFNVITFTREDYSNFGNFSTKGRGCNFTKIKQVCEKYPVFMESDYFKEIVDAELTWNVVTSIEKSECYMYDLTVEGSPTYLLNGYVTHNTTWSLNIARLNAYELGYNIVYISLETPKQDMNWNLLSRHSYEVHLSKFPYVGHDRMRHCQMTKDEEDFIFNEVEPDLKGSYVDENGQEHKRGKIIILDESDFNTFSFGEITAVLEKVDDELNHQLDAVIVDYVQLCKFSGSGFTSDANAQINSYVTFFRRLCQNFRKEVDANGNETVRQLTMILLAQLNRTGWQKAVRNNGVYQLDALADANELERGSARIFTTFTTEDMKARKSAQVQILKNRTGQTLYDPVTVFADGECYVFMDEDNQAGSTWGSAGAGVGQSAMEAAFSGIDMDSFGGFGL